jgi:hypothetical protein
MKIGLLISFLMGFGWCFDFSQMSSAHAQELPAGVVCVDPFVANEDGFCDLDITSPNAGFLVLPMFQIDDDGLTGRIFNKSKDLRIDINSSPMNTGDDGAVPIPNADLDEAKIADLNERTETSRSCERESCPLYIHVDKSAQRLYLYWNHQLRAVWPTSTGRKGYETPDLDMHPTGPLYKTHSSSLYPGNDNMPFDVVVSDATAIGIHGAPGGEDSHLGHPASHGCIRIRTSNAQLLNSTVGRVGTHATWVKIDSERDPSANVQDADGISTSGGSVPSGNT